MLLCIQSSNFGSDYTCYCVSSLRILAVTPFGCSHTYWSLHIQSSGAHTVSKLCLDMVVSHAVQSSHAGRLNSLRHSPKPGRPDWPPEN